MKKVDFTHTLKNINREFQGISIEWQNIFWPNWPQI